MNNYYQSDFPSEELQRQYERQVSATQTDLGGVPEGGATRPDASLAMSESARLDPNQDTPMGGGESLDDIIKSNSQELRRRRSLPQQHFASDIPVERRTSVIEFSNPGNSFGDFSFHQDSVTIGGQYSGLLPLTLSSQTNAYIHAPNILPLSNTDFSPDLVDNMMGFSRLDMGGMTGDTNALNMYTSATAGSGFSQNPLTSMATDFSGMDMKSDEIALNTTANTAFTGLSLDQEDDDLIGGTRYDAAGDDNSMSVSHGLESFAAHFPGDSSTTRFQPIPETLETAAGLDAGQQASSVASPIEPPLPQPPPSQSQVKPVYSKSGFDMVRALWYVATRPNPEISLGAVDLSCAFVVCDVTMNDCPIIYVSDNFQNLTGYNRHEIEGKNCRFLQAPSGIVEAGSTREFVDNGAVLNLRTKIAEGKEVQQSLINYRKGGKPFLNLLTMIPIPWDTKEIRYFIGFQIDLVECPDAIASGQDLGGVKVNYKHSDIGQHVWVPPQTTQWEPETGQTFSVDDVSTLLQGSNSQGSASEWHKQSWEKMLLENADDVVHVLSLKGLFLFLSPACKKVLEWDSHELTGNAISTICHPSDIVPVTRELKEATAGTPVNIVFRIRRKHSGYMWFESHGSQFVEQGKGRKSMILIGRRRPVLTLNRIALEDNGGIGDNELWLKISTSGLILFVSTNSRSVLDIQPEALVGTSMQEMMRKESRAEFGRTIEKARRGKIVSCKHEVHHKRGNVLQAQTTIYPGDKDDDEMKPTFLLAQTKLVRASSRTSSGGAPKPSAVPGISTGRGLDDNTPPIQAGSHGIPQAGPNGSNSGSSSLASGIDPAQGGLQRDTGKSVVPVINNIFDELNPTRCTSWQYELRQMEKVNRVLAEELHILVTNKKKRKRRKGVGNVVRDCANCHTLNTPEWRRGPSGQRDLCNSCGLRWAKQIGRVSPRNSTRGGNGNGGNGGNGDNASKLSNSPVHSSPLAREISYEGLDNGGEGDLSNQSGSSDPTSPKRTPPGGEGGAATTTEVVVASYSRVSFDIPQQSLPPRSQPMLEGGSGVEMTVIREECEFNL